MKTLRLFFVLFSFHSVSAQTLSPVAQALYTECYNADVTQAQTLLNNGAQVIGTSDGNSFYLKWLPPGATPSLTPMLVTLHGSHGRAFVEMNNWFQKASSKGVGIIAIQWYRGANAVSPNDYFDDLTLYSYIDTALKRLKYPSNKAMLHGFSRGSARSYALAFYDSQPIGHNYFCTVLSNAGKPDSMYPIYQQINSNSFGHSFYIGKRWCMYAGADDPDVGQSGIQGMNMANTWVMSNGGNVGIYIKGASPLGHDGFHTVPAYLDSVLNYYLPCFRGTVGIAEYGEKESFKIRSSLSGEDIVLQVENDENVTLKLYSIEGRVIYESALGDLKTNSPSHFVLSLKNVQAGIYLVTLNGHDFNATKKIIVEHR